MLAYTTFRDTTTFANATHIIASVLDQTLPPIQKHTSGETPKACSVCTITCSQAMLAADAARARRSPQPRVTLVNTSVYLKPAKLINVAFDVLARLAPCLNLRVRKLGHKDPLDTIGTDNCRK